MNQNMGYGPPGQMPPPGAPPYGVPYGGGYGYEFNQAENQTIGGAATWARVLAIILIVLGGLEIMQGSLFGGVINLVTGLYLNGAATSLKAVVDTQGNDIANMMAALSKIGTTFKIRVITTFVVLGLLVLIFLGVGAIMLLAVMSKH